jgi:S-adenosylmethionine synthetase
MQQDFVFTSEAVTPGHPDKLCDQISDAIVGRFLRQDAHARVSAECAVSTSIVFLSVKLSSAATVNVADVARSVIRDAGYVGPTGFADQSCAVMNSIHEHRAKITRSDARPDVLEQLTSEDQATVFGFACRHTPMLMPLPIWLARRLSVQLDLARRQGEIPYLAPDGKTQVGVEFRKRQPYRIHSVTIVASHHEGITLEQLRQDVHERVLGVVFDDEEIRPDPDTRISINPDGAFIDGGPEYHAGLTGRKNGMDTYGEFARSSAAALSGKDLLRVDRLGAYAARYAAKNVVLGGLADQCEVQLSYSIGLASPVSIQVETYGTARISEDEIAKRLQAKVDFRVGALLQRFQLADGGLTHDGELLRKLAAGGHFGRPDLTLPWEATDLAQQLGK